VVIELTSCYIQIEGMFDPSPEIKKTERVAAKFSSAEQEAALRKMELTSLKQSPRLVCFTSVI